MNSTEIYQKRMNRILDYIPLHLEEDIPLETLADQAGFSRYHFHRIFTAVVGETPADYVQRLRVELAANYLVKTTRTITQIAQEAGFSNSAVFARAFRQRMGLTPSEYRVGKRPAVDPAPAALFHPTHPSDKFVLDPASVQEFPDIPVVYAACYEGYSLEKICLAWDRVDRWTALHGVLGPDSLGIGISLDDPQITLKKKCRYYACLSTPTLIRDCHPLGSLVIPGGQYAVFNSECLASDIAYIYHIIYREWLPSSGYEPSNSFPCEVYLHAATDPTREVYHMQVRIPVQRIR
jgi:AraC family transcriptional regulator